MRYRRAVEKLRVLGEACTWSTTLPFDEPFLREAYVFGKVLTGADPPVEKYVEVAMVLNLPSRDVPWESQPRGTAWLVDHLRLDKGGYRYWWRSREDPVAEPCDPRTGPVLVGDGRIRRGGAPGARRTAFRRPAPYSGRTRTCPRRRRTRLGVGASTHGLRIVLGAGVGGANTAVSAGIPRTPCGRPYTAIWTCSTPRNAAGVMTPDRVRKAYPPPRRADRAVLGGILARVSADRASLARNCPVVEAAVGLSDGWATTDGR